MIRQTRNFIKLKQKFVITRINDWESNVKCFNAFSLHTMRAIRQCVIRYFLVKALQMTKRVVLYRLSRTRQKIFRSLMFNAVIWFKIVSNLYKKRLLSENLLEKYKVDNFESFLKRKNEWMKFSQLSKKQFQIIYTLLDRDLKNLFTSFTTSKKSSSKQSNSTIDEDVIDENTIDENTICRNA